MHSSTSSSAAPGPLSGVRVLELAGQGPAPWCAMMLSDMGADVLRVDRSGDVGSLRAVTDHTQFANLRGRRSVAIDLKHDSGREVFLRFVDQSDVVLEGFRPGVVERLGIGPVECLERRASLIYGRMTGWGQDGPWRHTAGHDINYIALTGMLNAIGTREKPVPPLNLAGDFGGGGLLLAFGVVAALLESKTSGKGQVVDAAMVDGAALLGGMFHGLAQTGRWKDERAANMLDGGAHFYGTYETSDNLWVAVGAIEPKFYSTLVGALGLSETALGPQNDEDKWPENRRVFAEVFRTRTRADWTELLQPLEACFSPVLNFDEALSHPHALARRAFIPVDGVMQPAPAPRFSRSEVRAARGAARPGEHTVELLREFGFDASEIHELQFNRAVIAEQTNVLVQDRS
ncbi:carnitine dehydratase [Rhodococcus sp. 15-725-2-2b]|nr:MULTISPECIES: CaiB/BaiF CoA-transferase family protein [unclassified Rhodococcus (in: high G+C Gram-positive bacteria)]OZC63700.1 carnitine dehydratase [Rhodococcus sp. 06-469-3-2]OZD40997.1 carnitine dehydratase [Rhodococcus sp. 06-1477-1A]OZE67223.1 carnitine dehydratase [Rhodococcus sp. 15-725-2-2b]